MNTTPPIKPEKFFKTACYFEGSLIFIAVVLGWIADINPFEALHFSETAVFYGFVGTLPLILIYLVLDQLKIHSVQKIRAILLETLAPSLKSLNWADFVILALVAGVSEEVLFRGLIQPWIENSWGFQIGLIASSLLFGLVHAITPLYMVLAVSISLYLGLALDYETERNLLTPIIIHAVYDFFAFLMIMHAYKKSVLKEGEKDAK